MPRVGSALPAEPITRAGVTSVFLRKSTLQCYYTKKIVEFKAGSASEYSQSATGETSRTDDAAIE